MDFSDRHVVVTGGTGALGSAVVARLLAAGAVCHVPCLAEVEREHFAHAEHPSVRLVADVDLADEAAVVAFYEGIDASLWASIHIAGGFAMQPFRETSLEAFIHQMRMNAQTCFLSAREALRRMSGPGRLVNVAARPALEPRLGAGIVAYTMAKAAVAAMTQALAEEVAGEGVWVNAVAPSIMDTPTNRAAMPDADHTAWASVGAVAETVVFLASPANACTRGGVVPVYGRS